MNHRQRAVLFVAAGSLLVSPLLMVMAVLVTQGRHLFAALVVVALLIIAKRVGSTIDYLHEALAWEVPAKRAPDAAARLAHAVAEDMRGDPPPEAEAQAMFTERPALTGTIEPVEGKPGRYIFKRDGD